MAYATPMVMQGFRPKCQYCDEPDTHFEYLHDNVGLISCDKHRELAERDARAWCAGQGLVRWTCAVNDPLFVEGGLLTWAGPKPQMNDIKVRRSSGAVEGGWELHPPTRSWIESNYVTRSKTTGRWSVQVIQKYSEITRGLLVEDLKLTVPEAKWGLVDAFLARLEAGFYTAEHMAFKEAVAAAKAQPVKPVSAAAQEIGRLLETHDSRAAACAAALAELAAAKAAFGALCGGAMGDYLARSAEEQEAEARQLSEANKRLELAKDVASMLW